ncbi:hypothetical protein [Singulisphaera acidiphila]|uniref:DUF3352 domain-containing protein n=1 Tax=Singulisphaera acidiphila (strain ATCC BAA-1392 / DSM 18658 / VKM B-2454 / MOB10) TaxID=886293 RepID=L0DIY0_SINAD|nr:hypothetical protein [Singulisphaera acidiphila]AGA28773.1 hypothetical protein Sinac_4595 [Singulisphaera acidiphila DSM 18658]
MLAQLLSIWVVAATLGQTPADSAWLKAVPGDVDLVIRSRGLEATSVDLTAMLKAMSPRLGAMAEPALTDLLSKFKDQHGETAIKTAWVGLVRAVPPGPDGVIPFAVLVIQEDYRSVLKSLAGGKDVALKPQDGGFDAFDNPHGNGLWYAVKGPGFVAFGPDKEFIAAAAKPGEKTLDQVLTPALAKLFLAGDLGLFVNTAKLSTRYAAQIDLGRQKFMDSLDQAGKQGPNGPSIEGIKAMYGRFFDAIKEADSLALNLDFAAEGFQLGGQLDVKAGSDVAKAIDPSRSGAADLSKFAPDAAFYVSMNMDAKEAARLQSMSLSMINPGAKESPEMTAATERFNQLGQIETQGNVTFGNGMRAFNVINVADPKAYIAAVEAMLQAMKKADSPLNFYKDVKVDADVETYQGIKFTHVVATFDDEKLAKLGAMNQGGAASVKAMFGGDAFSYWIGTDGKRVLYITTPTWDEAKAQIDVYTKGDAGLGTVPTYPFVRAALPEQASLLMIVSAQGLVRMFASQLSATLNKPELKVPEGLPKEPALFGGSITPRAPRGIEFHFVLPSQVGPIIEKGMIPLFQGLQGNVNQ